MRNKHTLRNVRIINAKAIYENMRLIRSEIPSDVSVMAVVKADGYGHGDLTAARAALFGGADQLAVASVDEGCRLRAQGVREPILVLGAVTESEVLSGVEHGLTQTVCSPEMVFLCERAGERLHREAAVHLKVDSGMGRIGVRNAAEFESVLSALARARHIRLSGVFTHFADADGNEEGEAYTYQQYRLFQEMTRSLPEDVLRHCANSAAIHRYPEMRMNMVRVGISLYGYPPVQTDLRLQRCMEWKCSVSYIKEVSDGDFVSYGRTYRAEGTRKIATVTCGYADGYPRCASGKAAVLIRGHRVPVVGRICMDQMMVDITGCDDIETGDETILMGQDGSDVITAEDIAGWCDTISYEILVHTGSRVVRKVIHPDFIEGDRFADEGK